MTKSIYYTLFFALITACVFSSCQSSKIAYGNSYYFKQTPKKVVATEQPTTRTEAPAQLEKQALSSTNLQASAAPEIKNQQDVEVMIATAQQQLAEKLEQSNDEELKESVSRINALAASANEQSLSKKEKNQRRKEIRKEIKSLTKEYKAAAPEDAKEMDSSLRLSIILGGAGLLAMIIGGVVGGSAGGVLALLGLLALIGGLVILIIWATRQ